MARMPDLRIAMRKMRVLFIGAHCDDIELGCGGLIHKLATEGNGMYELRTLTLCRTSLDARLNNGVWGDLSYTQSKALQILTEDVTPISMEWGDVECRGFAEFRQEVYDLLNSELCVFKPDLVFCNEADEHQDHEALFKEIKRFRNLNLFTYSLRKLPGHFIVPLSLENMSAKSEALLCYEMYRSRSYFQPYSIAMATAMQSGCSHAESFTVQSMYDWNFGVSIFSGEVT